MIRIALSWTCYGLGDFWSRVAVNRGLGEWFEWPYIVYNRLMNWAHQLQGDDPRGPWEPVDHEQEAKP